MRHPAAFCAALLSCLAGPASAFDQDNQVRVWWGPNFKEPGVVNGDNQSENVPKAIVSLTHSDDWRWGSNFLNVDTLKSIGADPAENSTDGAVEVYAVDRNDFSLGKISGSGDFASGPVRDLALTIGADANTKNTTFNSQKRMPVAGISAVLAVPFFWKVSMLWDKEFSHNGITGRSVIYDSTARFETAWDVPFTMSGNGFDFEGFGLVNGPKGRDGFGVETRTETLLHPKLMWDVGALVMDPGHLKAGAGYEFWQNKFGEDHTKVAGSEQDAVFLEVDYHL